jgi:hypothetical protein
VERHQPAARFDEMKERFLLLGRDASGVGVNHQTVKAREFGGIHILHLVGVNQFDAARSQHGLELLETIGGPVMAVVAEEKHARLSRFASREHRNGQEQVQSQRDRAEKAGAAAVVEVFHRGASFTPATGIVNSPAAVARQFAFWLPTA